MTELETALAYLRHLVGEPISEKERVAARRLLVDSIGCALGGARDDIAVMTTGTLARDPDGVGILGSDVRLRPADALLVHAAAIRCMDFNDIFSRRNNQHPSEFVVPIVLALAEREKWSGARAIDATAIGYRIFLAMGEMWEGLLGRGWAPSASLGRHTAAALVALLRGCDDTVTANAMAIGAITAPTLGAVFKGQLSSAKSLVNGMAARAGWEAVDLAVAGITGPRDAFEAAGGFDTMAGGPFIPPDKGQPMLTAADVSLKAYPTMFMTHTSIASAIDIAPRISGRLADVKSVSVRVPEKVVAMAAAESKWQVTTREAAQFSLPLSVATSLVNGACGLQELTTERLSAPEVKAILSVMDVAADNKWKGYEGGRVEVALADGTMLSAETDAAPGHPKNPMTDDAVLAKFTSLATETLGAKTAASVAAAIAALPEAKDIGALMTASRV